MYFLFGIGGMIALVIRYYCVFDGQLYSIQSYHLCCTQQSGSMFGYSVEFRFHARSYSFSTENKVKCGGIRVW